MILFEGDKAPNKIRRTENAIAVGNDLGSFTT